MSVSILPAKQRRFMSYRLKMKKTTFEYFKIGAWEFDEISSECKHLKLLTNVTHKQKELQLMGNLQNS